MSWFVEHGDGEFLGDFATNRGINELRDHPQCPGPLLKFLDEGEADAELVAKIVEACKDKPPFDYIARMFREADPPIRLSDGVS